MNAEQGDWPDLVEDMVFLDNTQTGYVTVTITAIDEDEEEPVHVSYHCPVRSFGPGGFTWDREEIDSERLPKGEVYARMNNDSWTLESVPVGVTSGDHR